MIIYTPDDVEKVVKDLIESPLISLFMIGTIFVGIILFIAAVIGLSEGYSEYSSQCKTRLCSMLLVYQPAYEIGKWLKQNNGDGG